MAIVVRGATVLVPSGPARDPQRMHLCVLLTDSHGPGQQILMVPINSVKPARPHDSTCLLAAGDNPFIKHESYVAYDRCRVEHTVHVEKLIASGFSSRKSRLLTRSWSVSLKGCAHQRAPSRSPGTFCVTGQSRPARHDVHAAWRTKGELPPLERRQELNGGLAAG